MNKKSTSRSRSAKLLTDSQISQLHALGIRENTSHNDLAWEEQYAAVKAFYAENGHLHIPKSYVGVNGKGAGCRRREGTGKKTGSPMRRYGCLTRSVWSGFHPVRPPVRLRKSTAMMAQGERGWQIDIVYEINWTSTAFGRISTRWSGSPQKRAK